MNKLEENSNYNNKTFEDIKHIDGNGIEYWYARELMNVLQYAKWENFKKVIEKAIIACENSEISTKDCFLDIRKPIISGKGKEEFIEDYKLTRYACYLIAQNGDTRKKVIALAQTYSIKKPLLEKIIFKGGFYEKFNKKYKNKKYYINGNTNNFDSYIFII